MPDVEHIVSLLAAREQDYLELRAAGEQTRRLYAGEDKVVLPDMEKMEDSSLPNFVQKAVDQTAMRIASVLPEVKFPAVKDGQKGYEDRARLRRAAVMNMHAENRLALKMKHRARHFITYAFSPILILPDHKSSSAKWTVRNPRQAFPALPTEVDSMEPANCIFVVERTLAWLRATYPEAARQMSGSDAKADTRVRIVEYVDADVRMLVADSSQNKPHDLWPSIGMNNQGVPGGVRATLLETQELGLSRCPVVCPWTIGLDGPVGQFDGASSQYRMLAKLAVLQYYASVKAVFPDEWVVPLQANGMPEIKVNANGQKGERGLIHDGRLDVQNNLVNFSVQDQIDRMERGLRIETQMPAEFTGESNTNIRTGRRGDAVLSAMIDFPIQEAQDLLAESIHLENMRAIEIERTFFGGARRSFYFGKRNPEKVDYRPSELWTTDWHQVKHTFSGADLNGLVISAGQRVGMGSMSLRTFQEMDPLVDDPEMESDRVKGEALDQALLQSIQQQAVAGALPPADAARIKQLVVTDQMDLADAIVKAQEEAQERQATEVPEGDPAAQPGLAQPGMGAEQPVERVQRNPDVNALRNVLGDFALPQQLSGQLG